MENLNEFIFRYQQYKEGSYECETITSPYDVKKIVEGGKKVVFIGSNVNTIVWFGVGGLFLIVGLIVGIAMTFWFFNWVVFTIMMGITGIPGIFGLFLGLWYIRKRFMVIGPEGIAYKLRTHGVRGYNWKDIKMDLYNLSLIKSKGLETLKIHIFMPNGDFIKVEPGNYFCKEIPMRKYSISFSTGYLKKVALFMLLFASYSGYAKDGTFEWQTRRPEDKKKKPKPLNSAMGTDMFIIDTWRDQLKKALYNYRKKKYKFGKFWTNEQLQDHFLRKKIFVLRGGIRLEMWFVVALCFFPLIPSLIILNPLDGNISMDEFLSFIVIGLILGFSFSSPFFVVLTRFLVISSSGVYYRKFIRKKVFSWDDISRIDGINPNPTRIYDIVKIYLLSGKKIKFAANLYRRNEFSKKAFPELFFSLFDINFKLSRNFFH